MGGTKTGRVAPGKVVIRGELEITGMEERLKKKEIELNKRERALKKRERALKKKR